MNRYNRKEIICTKVLPNGIRERFKVIVMAEDTDKAVKKYKEQGYNCFVKEGM